MAPQQRGSSLSSVRSSPTCAALSYDGLFLAKVRSGHKRHLRNFPQPSEESTCIRMPIPQNVLAGGTLPARELENLVAAAIREMHDGSYLVDELREIDFYFPADVFPVLAGISKFLRLWAFPAIGLSNPNRKDSGIHKREDQIAGRDLTH